MAIDPLSIITNYFGEERVCITHKIESNRKQHTVIIHFPSIDVKNRAGFTHTIRDLYLNLIFYTQPDGTLGFRHINLARTTFTKKELQAGYIFSHVPSTQLSSVNHVKPFGEYKAPCLGSGDFANFIVDLSKGLPITAITMSRLCGGLDAYVRWESMDTAPYIRMETIYQNYTPNSVIRSDGYYHVDNSIYHSLVKILIPLLTWKVQTSPLGVQTFEVANPLASLCLNLMTECQQKNSRLYQLLISSSTWHAYYNSETHKFYTSRGSMAFWKNFWKEHYDPSKEYPSAVVFKKQTININIIEESDETSDEMEKFGLGVSPLVVNNIVARLSSDLNTFLYNEELKNRSSSHTNGEKS